MAFTVSGCYDDSALKTDISDLQNRVKTLEEQMRTANGNIATLQGLVETLNGRVSITSVNETASGWEIVFSDGRTATITNGHSPVIGISKTSDGIYYWTLDGKWLLDGQGNKIPVSGQDGKDGVAPMLTIEGGYWYVSTDSGSTWTKLGKATGENGANGDSIFQSVSQDESFWYFTLAGGDIIKIGRGIHGAKSVNVIPSYSDGSVKAEKGKFTMSFDVLPAQAAEGLAGESNDIFNVKVVYTIPATKTSNSLSLPILSKEGKEGVLLLTVDGSGLDDSFVKGTSGASACLQIVWNDNVLSSGYFPLKYFDPYNGHEYVDLGLPSGLKWATCNVGATKPEAYGDYFAWGETEPKEKYNWSNYKYCKDGNPEAITKYCPENQAKYWGGEGTPDGKTEFKDYGYEDDAARDNWGGSWRTPTKAEWKELMDNCTWAWTDNFNDTGVRGMMGSSKTSGYTDKTIFFPASSLWIDALLFLGEKCYYWSSSLGNAYQSVCFYAGYSRPDHVAISNSNRCYGHSVRAVID